MEIEAHQRVLPAEERELVWCAALGWKREDGLALWVGSGIL